MHISLRTLSLQRCRAFSHTAAVQARRARQEIRQSMPNPPPVKPTSDELKRLLVRESERAFGPEISGDPITFVNKLSDDAWKEIFKISGNDPEVLQAWRDHIKTRMESGAKPTTSSKGGHRG